MPNREAHSRIVPRVFAEDSGGYRLPAKCAHCKAVIAKADLAWGSATGDPPGFERPLHTRCEREYRLFAIALGLPG
jgi:hypothetical protein